MTTLRLDREIEYKLHKVAKIEARTKSEIIKELILNYLESYEENKKSPYELGKQYFGKVNTGNKNGSVEYKSIIAEKIKSKLRKKWKKQSSTQASSLLFLMNPINIAKPWEVFLKLTKVNFIQLNPL